MSDRAGSGALVAPGAQRRDGAAGARFNLRFEGARGVLELSRGCRGQFVQLERARLRIPRVTFPLDVTQGAARFRSKRTFAESFRFSIAASSVATWAKRHSLSVFDFAVLDARTFSCTLIDALGPLSASFGLLLEGEDLVIIPLDAYSPVDSPKSAWQRLKDVVLSLGMTIHSRYGGFVAPRVVHWLFVDALVRHGYRAPVAASAGPCSVRFVAERCVVEAGDFAEEEAALDERTRSEVWLVQVQRTAQLRLDLFDGQWLAIGRALEVFEHQSEQQRIENWSLLREPALLRAECLASVENGEAEALFALRHARVETDVYVELRLALRRQDHLEVVRLCEQILRTETSWRLAAAAIRGCLYSLHGTARHQLARQAFARIPSDVVFACEVIADAHTESTAEVERAAEIAFRSMATAAERAEVADAAARALAAESDAGRALYWASEAVSSEPARAVYLFHYGRLLADAGRAAEATAHLRHAAAAFEAAGETTASAEAMFVAARCFEQLAMPGAAKNLLSEACSLDQHNWRSQYALAKLSLQSGELGAAQPCIAAMAHAASSRAGLTDVGDESELAEALVSVVKMLAEGATESGSGLRTAKIALDAATRLEPGHRDLDAAKLLVATLLSKTVLDEPSLLDSVPLPELARLLAALHPTDCVKLLGARAWTETLLPRRSLLLQRLLEAVLECGDGELARGFASSLLNSPSDIAGFVEAVGPMPLARLLGLLPDPVLLDRACRVLSLAFERDGHVAAAIDCLASAGVRNRDAGLLRAALELAERHGLFALALDAIDYALHVVPEGNSRDALLARRLIVQSSLEARQSLKE